MNAFYKVMTLYAKKCLWNLLVTYIYIYMYVLFGPVKPDLGVIPSGQKNHSTVNI